MPPDSPITNAKWPRNSQETIAADSTSENRMPLVGCASSAPTFNYSTVTAELAEALRADAERIRHRITRSTSDMIEIGRDFKAVKAKLEHGQFIQWVESEIGINRRTAQRYIRVADLADAKGDTVSLLTPGTAYRLSARSTPPETVGAVLRRVEAGELFTDKAVHSLVRKQEQRNDEQRELRPQYSVEQSAMQPSAEPCQSEPKDYQPETEDPAQAVAQKLFSKLGMELTGVVLDALRQDTTTVLHKLQKLLAQSSAHSSTCPDKETDRPSVAFHPAEPVSGRLPTKQPEIPEMPPFLDRRTRNRR